jgi:hypothetical protein
MCEDRPDDDLRRSTISQRLSNPESSEIPFWCKEILLCKESSLARPGDFVENEGGTQDELYVLQAENRGEPGRLKEPGEVGGPAPIGDRGHPGGRGSSTVLRRSLYPEES